MDTPYSKKRSAQYRGPNTSDDYNARIHEVYQDLTVLYNRARLSEVELDELYRRMVKDQASITTYLESLEDRVKTLEDDATVFTFHSSSQYIDDDSPTPNPLNDTEFGIDEVDRLKLDAQHGLLTLPVVETSSMSKVRFAGVDGEEVVPPGLEMRVVGDNSTADSPTATLDTSEPEYALYRKPGLIWERNVVVDAPDADGAVLTLYVRVPTDLFTTAQTNSIVVHAFPVFGTRVEEIAYSVTPDPLLRDSDGYNPFNDAEHYSGEDDAVGWVIPGGWTGINEGADAIVDAPPRKFIFEPKTITAIRIRLKQEDFYQEGSKYIYTYGLSHLDVRFDKFLTEGRALIQVDAPDSGTISSINSVEPQIYNVSPARIPDVFEYRTIWETSPDSGEYTTTAQPNSEKMWIEVTLKEDAGGWSPALTSLTVDYS